MASDTWYGRWRAGGSTWLWQGLLGQTQEGLIDVRHHAGIISGHRQTTAGAELQGEGTE